MDKKRVNKREKCDGCNKSFSDISNLRKHIKKAHKNELELQKYYKYKVKDLYEYSCHCGKNFSRKSNKYHLKSHLTDKGECSTTNQRQKCPLCDFNCATEKNLHEHFKNMHCIDLEVEELMFHNYEEFQKWKDEIENDTASRYVKIRSRTNCSAADQYIKFGCSRSGFYTPKLKNRSRRLKVQGSNKINGICPAGMIVNILQTGECMCKFTKNHIGHANDLGHLTLSTLERQICAEKIALKIPFDVILDQVRESVSDSHFQRLHLLTRKDLINIEKSYNLSSEAIRHQNDAVSVHAWIKEVEEANYMCVLFYKPQDIMVEQHPQLKKEDFILIIMNQAQCEILKKFGSECICLDSTKGMNNNHFQLTTLMIIDELHQGFPCAFLLSNRVDKEVLKVFFLYVKMYSETIVPQVLMTDIAESSYNAWNEVMGRPEIRLYCSWHIDQAWRENLEKIRIKEKQMQVYKFLRMIMEEKDVNAFYKMKDEICDELLKDPDTQEFGEYFVNFFSQNCESWAYCFRLQIGIDANMHLERMHQTLKHLYFDGKRGKRLDKAITAIMKMIKGKLFDKTIVLNKGTIISKLKDIRQRHKASLKLNPEHLRESEDGWEVLSSKSQELYCIKEVNLSCKCQLVCNECHLCLHNYSCSCADSSIKWVMCKHIHLLGRKLRDSMDDNLSEMEIQEDQNVDLEVITIETEFTTSEIGEDEPENEESIVNLELEQIKCDFLETIRGVTNMAQIDVIKRCIAPIKPQLEALEARSTPAIKIKPLQTFF